MDYDRLKRLVNEGDTEAASRLLNHAKRTSDIALAYKCAMLLAKTGEVERCTAFAWSEVNRLTGNPRLIFSHEFKPSNLTSSPNQTRGSRCEYTVNEETGYVGHYSTNRVACGQPAEAHAVPVDSRPLYQLAIAIESLELCRKAMVLWWPSCWWRWLCQWVVKHPSWTFGARGHICTLTPNNPPRIAPTSTDPGEAFPPMPDLPECVCNGTGRCPRCGTIANEPVRPSKGYRVINNHVSISEAMSPARGKS